MRNMMTFVCPELDLTYAEIYAELAQALEMTPEEVLELSPDDAVARLRYHRRQASRRAVFTELAEMLGVDTMTVFSAVSAEGARILLDAVRERRGVKA